MFKLGDIVKESIYRFAGTNRQQIDDVRLKFVRHFQGCEYEIVAADPIIPKSDKTVLFSNATITPVKALLEKGKIPDHGWVVDQPCLRLQNLSLYPDRQFEPEYMSFFHMVGIYTPVLNEKNVTEIWSVFRKCGLDISRISLEGCGRDRDMAEILSLYAPQKIAFRERAVHEGYYDWKYDFKSYVGRGIHFMINQGKPFSCLSIGQLVEMSDGDELVGYEFGFGIETFLARKDFSPSIYLKGAGAEHLGMPKQNFDLQYQDLLVSSIVMFAAGILPGKGGRSSLLRKAMRQLVYMEEMKDVAPANNRQLEGIFEEVRSSVSTHKEVSEYIAMLSGCRESIRSSIALGLRYIKERMFDVDRGIIDRDYAWKKIGEYVANIGIPQLEFKDVFSMKRDSSESLSFQPELRIK